MSISTIASFFESTISTSSQAASQSSQAITGSNAFAQLIEDVMSGNSQQSAFSVSGVNAGAIGNSAYITTGSADDGSGEVNYAMTGDFNSDNESSILSDANQLSADASTGLLNLGQGIEQLESDSLSSEFSISGVSAGASNYNAASAYSTAANNPSGGGIDLMAMLSSISLSPTTSGTGVVTESMLGIFA